MLRFNTSSVEYTVDVFDPEDYNLWPCLNTTVENSTRHYMLVLYGIVRAQGFTKLVELGVFGGNTSRILLQAAEKNGGRLLCVDIERSFIEALEASVRGHERLTTFCGRSTDETLEVFHPDFVFVDADHSYEGVQKDFMFWWPRLDVGGVMCFHDSRTAPDVAQFLSKVFPRHDAEFVQLPGDTGLLIARKVEG